MTVNFYNFTKRANSTLRPAGTPVLSVEATMRNEASIVSPVLELHNTAAINTRTMNYVYIPLYDRYYFVSDWTWDSGLWYISLTEDVLASWKDTIGSTTDYVVRSAYRSNPYISDTLYPMSGRISINRVQQQQLFQYGDLSSGIFVIGVCGCGYDNQNPPVAVSPGTEYYAFRTVSDYNSFFEALFSDAYAETVLGWSATIIAPELKMRTNPIQYIQSVRWYPFFPAEDWNTWANAGDIAVGWGFVPTQNAKRITGTYRVDFQRLFLHGAHPQSARGDYLNWAPYTKQQLFIPPFGNFELDPRIVYEAQALNCEIYVDMRSGNAYMSVFAANISGEDVTNVSRLIWTSAKVSVECALTQIMAPGFGIGSIMSTAFQGASGLASAYMGRPEGAITGAVGFANGITDFVASGVPTATTRGSDGSKASFIGRPTLETIYYLVVDDDNAQRGRPLCERVQISTIPGFLVITDPDFACNGTSEEINKIREFMAGGMFYE